MGQAAVICGDAAVLGRPAGGGSRRWAWPPPASAQHPYLVAKSEFFTRPLPAAAAAALVENFVQGRPAGESRELDFMPWGGAYNRVPPPPPPLSTAMRASSSSTRPWSTPKPRPLQHKPRIGG
jgi:hypothetical protein